ncbi:hypothetical protein [Gemmatimonas sp.]|uniref:hypothetical protein n=1 Tax=Gemmatimonas sp. TaxID=1962908 RepID=UPI00286B2316|nr:hypothetical protein [Gemmatimonas sp.]
MRTRRKARTAPEHFGDRLRVAMASRGWSNSELARRFQALRESNGNPLESPPTRTIGQYLAGSRLPRADGLRDLAELLEVSTDWLLWGDDYPRERGARTAIGTLSIELKEHLWRALLVRSAEHLALPLGAVSETLSDGPTTLAIVEQLAREHVRRTVGEAAGRHWELLERAIARLHPENLYGASQEEADALAEAIRTIRGQRLLVLQDASAAEGLSPIFAVSTRTAGGKWVAEMAIHRAAAWLDDLGMVAVVPTDLRIEDGVELARDKASKAVLFRESPRHGDRGRAESAAKARLRGRSRSISAIPQRPTCSH